MSLSPFIDTILSLHFKHHVTLPLWHQGQRADQNQHTLPLFSSCRRSVLQIWGILKWPSSPWVHAESSNIFFNEVHDSMNFLSPMTHTYIKDPSKWIYIWDSATQPSGFTKFDSATQPSGFTNFTSPYMTEYYNFTSWVSSNYKYNFKTNTRNSSRKRTYFRTIIMPPMHYIQHYTMHYSPWICASKHPFHMTKAPP